MARHSLFLSVCNDVHRFRVVYSLSNLPNLWDDDVTFTLLHTNFVVPFLLFFFAFMYKVVADAVEENNLTV